MHGTKLPFAIAELCGLGLSLKFATFIPFSSGVTRKFSGLFGGSDETDSMEVPGISQIINTIIFPLLLGARVCSVLFPTRHAQVWFAGWRNSHLLPSYWLEAHETNRNMDDRGKQQKKWFNIKENSLLAQHSWGTGKRFKQLSGYRLKFMSASLAYATCINHPWPFNHHHNHNGLL